MVERQSARAKETIGIGLETRWYQAIASKQKTLANHPSASNACLKWPPFRCRFIPSSKKNARFGASARPSLRTYRLARNLKPEDGFFEFKHGIYGLRKHVRVAPKNWATVRNDVHRLPQKENWPVFTFELANQARFRGASFCRE